jgi:3-isopropylmalate/(R)-2-methylmalate dehydratase large subunit
MPFSFRRTASSTAISSKGFIAHLHVGEVHTRAVRLDADLHVASTTRFTATRTFIRRNAAKHGIPFIDIDDPRQGIVHIIGPELGFSLPGTLVACGDSHTCTNGGAGAIGVGIGASDVAHVLATQTLRLPRPKALRVRVSGVLPAWVSAKDVALHLIGRAGAGGAAGYAVEYAGQAVRAMAMDARFTLCNLSVEWGARIGMVAPDDTTYEYLCGRPLAPQGALWDKAIAHWRLLPTDDEARFDREIDLAASTIGPQITWGTSPDQVIDVGDSVPDPEAEPDSGRRSAAQRALRYMGLRPGMTLEGLLVDQVFIGSCANSRIDDLRAVAILVRGRRVAAGVRAMVVPGSAATRQQARHEGIDRILIEAGFEWHEAACSLCGSVNADVVPAQHRCVSTSNRNFEGRQGPGARTHLASPAMAAAAAVTGRISDVRKVFT